MTWLELLLAGLLYISIGLHFARLNERVELVALVGWPLWLLILVFAAIMRRLR